MSGTYKIARDCRFWSFFRYRGTALPGANDHSVVNILARLLGDADESPPSAPPTDVDDTSRCTFFSLSDAKEASDAFQASGLEFLWSDALSLPTLGPLRLEPTPALESLAKRNTLRNRNRELTGLTNGPSVLPSPKRRMKVQPLPMPPPHQSPNLGNFPHPPPRGDNSEFDDTPSHETPTDNDSVAASSATSMSLDDDFSSLFFTLPRNPRVSRRSQTRLNPSRRLEHQRQVNPKQHSEMK